MCLNQQLLNSIFNNIKAVILDDVIVTIFKLNTENVYEKLMKN